MRVCISRGRGRREAGLRWSPNTSPNQRQIDVERNSDTSSIFQIYNEPSNMYKERYKQGSQCQKSIILRQILKRRHIIPTAKSRLIRFLRHEPVLPCSAVAPLRGRLRPPGPVEPALACLEGRHLRLGVGLQELLVRGGIRRGVGDCRGTGAGRRIWVVCGRTAGF
jgi:hypothetical protein